MDFTFLRLENWRNFRSVEVDLSSRAFLVGPNASGKSNLLDAFRFLCDVASVGGGFQDAVNKRGGVSRMRCLAARKYSDIAVEVGVGNGSSRKWGYRLVFNQDNLRRPIIREEKVFQEDRPLINRPDVDDEADVARLSQTFLEQVNVNRSFRQLVEFFSSVKYLHVIPHLIREPDRWRAAKRDPFGSDLLEVIAATPEPTKRSRLGRITQALKVAVPQLQGLELDRDDRGAPHLRGKYEHWRPRGAWQTEKEFSDGTLRLMGLLWAVLDGTGPLLLEEPELSLHPDVVRFIPQMISRSQRRSGRQVLMSTHSRDLLTDRGIGLDEVLLLLPEDEGTAVALASSFHEVSDLLAGGLSMADAVIPRTRPRNPEQLSFFAG